MKKLSYIVLGLVIGAVLTYYFCPRNPELDAMETKLDTEAKIVKPRGVIKQAYAKELNKNWTKYRKPAVDSCAAMGGHKQDDRSVWWSAKELKHYLRYSKKQADSLNYKITGYRVYLGVYGQEAGPKKCNLSTMFLVPTGEKRHAEASMNPFNFVGNDSDLPIPPLNRGHGGSGGYPD
ncbi:hypothetical protein Q4Q34_15865 [Flavivirga abyssicola]|uniref:hypothetical protein n=1 Tax=Flavivirga abyssicola TaxID=3063533 RepID=UPI0026DEC995|nr:hypothetical protein [Flavivirga sp. MEBiC07777]WVK12693.1 hypothetical protein Q4Q34_15865 [Flavivirga sp. MEBiC07777]